MRRLILASYDNIMLNINAVIMLKKRGESTFLFYLLTLLKRVKIAIGHDNSLRMVHEL
jgi:hypothetical protein